MGVADTTGSVMGPCDAAWSWTRLLHLQADPHIGRITSPVLEEWGEANMVAVDYAMSDLTRYLVGSQDEIRLVNEPPGQYQIDPRTAI